MDRYTIVIVGAGAAGMMAAAAAAERGSKVLVLEKMEKAGRKIRITGKGRCNITNTKRWEEFSKHIHPKPNLFKHAFYSFSNDNTIDLFNRIGLETVIERGDRVFPASEKARDVADSLYNYIVSLGVDVKFNTRVDEIQTNSGRVESVAYECGGKRSIVYPKAVIIATGGLSYPTTGSDGDGYKIAQEVGHKIVECMPSLTALMPDKFDRSLEGLILKNVNIDLYISGSLSQSEFGEINFTSNGLEGPLGFRISRKAVKALINGNKVHVELDLKPAVCEDDLVKRINREVEQSGSTPTYGKLLPKLLPSQFIPFFASQFSLKTTSRVNLDDIKKLVSGLKSIKINIVDYTSYERSVVTAGGVSMQEIVSKSMQSKLVDNLFFAGEVLDIDGDTGGYNLQIAFSTGHLAGESAAKIL